ncbi:uncharacterized protein BDV14DRAFT_168974 [Aspergillus stella-maris]|uniref:uncharacterized protein n=1 Tax=Aspergillus stella-maris TaxID=1810926 RepID=UPI003CCD14AE
MSEVKEKDKDKDKARNSRSAPLQYPLQSTGYRPRTDNTPDSIPQTRNWIEEGN